MAEICHGRIWQNYVHCEARKPSSPDSSVQGSFSLGFLLGFLGGVSGCRLRVLGYRIATVLLGPIPSGVTMNWKIEPILVDQFYSNGEPIYSDVRALTFSPSFRSFLIISPFISHSSSPHYSSRFICNVICLLFLCDAGPRNYLSSRREPRKNVPCAGRLKARSAVPYRSLSGYWVIS